MRKGNAMRVITWVAAGLLLAGQAAAQQAPPLAPYAPPATQSPLAPLPGDAGPADPPLGAVRLRSDTASNSSSADTRSPIAPILPDPAATGDDAAAFLRAARAALSGGRTGEAQEALERAESRLLSRDVAPSEASSPASDAASQHVAAARQALSVGNTAAALQAIDAAMGAL